MTDSALILRNADDFSSGSSNFSEDCYVNELKNMRIQINFTLWNVSTLDERGKRKDYILDGNGNIIRVVEFINNGTNVITFNTTYRYDALNQLTQINDSKANQFNFTYDSLGRTIQLQDPDLRAWNYTYDSLGNLIAQEGAGGELTTDGDYYREYNALHQLTKIRKKTSTGKIIEEYSYGPDGERIMTVNYLTNTPIYTPFKEWMMIVNRTGSYNYTYVYDGNTLVARLNPDGTKWFYHDDHLGSTSLITDESGNIVEETFYNPFGQVTSGGEREAYLLYTNQMKDAIGCYDYGARVYCPKWYHFTSGDPITSNVFDPQGLNRYAYVKNNPYKYTDPSGNTVVFEDPYSYVQASDIVENTAISGWYTAFAFFTLFDKDLHQEMVDKAQTAGFNAIKSANPWAYPSIYEGDDFTLDDLEGYNYDPSLEDLSSDLLKVLSQGVAPDPQKELEKELEETTDPESPYARTREVEDTVDSASSINPNDRSTRSTSSTTSSTSSSSSPSGGYGTGSALANAVNEGRGYTTCSGCGSIDSDGSSWKKKGSSKSSGSGGSGNED